MGSKGRPVRSIHTEELLYFKLLKNLVLAIIKISEHTLHCSLLCMGLYSHRPVRGPMMTPVHHRKYLQWASDKTGPWSSGKRFHGLMDHSYFLIWWMVGCIALFVWGSDGSMKHDGTMGRRQADRGKYTPSWQWSSLMAVASFSMMYPDTLQILFGNCFRNMTKSLRCCLGFHIPQISIWRSISGMCWTNKSDPWMPHLSPYRT